MSRGKTVKSSQTGFNVELPATQVATIEVLSSFGDTEAGEGSIAKVTDGDIAGMDITSLFIAEPKEQP
jgi:hypothetical protein